MNVSGPFPADTLFVRAVRGEFDAVIAMYHDQGLVPVKLIAFGKSVNVTIGLPIVRTSVDHGTAVNIAGQGIANPSATILSATMMLDWLADRHGDPALADGARAIEAALAKAFASGTVCPREFGGSSGTADITRAVLEGL